MYKSYSQNSLGLRKYNASQLTTTKNSQNPSVILLGADKFQNWKFFNQEAVTVNSRTLANLGINSSPKAVLSPVRAFKQLQTTDAQRLKQSSVLTAGQESGIINLKKQKRSKSKASLVDKILEAAQETQEKELKDFFMTHVQTESILPPINLNDNKDYKSLMLKQKQISYLVSKHVRLASERMKYGKVENNHYQHYERLEPIETIIAKVKPSEATLNYKPRLEALQKPSLELMKTVNKQLNAEKEINGNNPITQDLIKDTYQTFGMNNDDIEDVDAILAEEGDKIEFESKEIKFTEHQYEFKTICGKVNKEKSAEIFIKTNKDFNKWNLRDKNQQVYFLSRAASKEPRNFIEKEIEEKKLKDEEYLYRKPIEIFKLENQYEEEVPKEENEDEYDSEGYEYYSETDRQSMQDQQPLVRIVESAEGNYDSQRLGREGLLTSENNQRAKVSSLSVAPKTQRQHKRRSSNSSSKRSKGTQLSKIERQLQKEEEDKKLQEKQLQEEEELKKFIFLEKLKYEKAIKGYDRVSGMKGNLDEFTDVIMHKLFQKREPTNEFKYILKKDNTHNRVDHSKPLYMDDLKRFQKLIQVGGKKQLNMIQHQPEDIKRNFQDINIFNADLEEDFKEQSPQKLERSQSQNILQPKVAQQEKKKINYNGAWYLPVTKWGKTSKIQTESKSQLSKNDQQIQQPQIGVLTKQAIKYLLVPYKEGSSKKVKLNNKFEDVNEEEEKEFQQQRFDADDDLVLLNDKDDKKLFNEFKQIILPGDQRIAVFEWLLDQYEPGILESKDLQKLDSVERIEMVLKQIGIINFSDKKGINQNQLLSSIEGLNGTIDSIQLLQRLSNFVVNSQQLENIDPKSFSQMNDKLLNYICTNQNSVFQPTVRLFPPGFPKTEEVSSDQADIDQLGILIDDLAFKVENIKQQLQNLNATTLQEYQDQISLAQPSDLNNLNQELTELKGLVNKFNEEFEDNLKRDLSKLAQNQMKTQMGQIVEDMHNHKQKMNKMTSDFSGVVEKLGKLNVKLQMAGLNEENNYSQNETYITNESILELDVFIDEEHHKYAQNQIREFEAHLEDLEYADQVIIAKLYTQILNNIEQGFDVRTLFNSAVMLAQKIEQRTYGINSCKIRFYPGKKGIDSAGMDFRVFRSNHYFTIPHYGYYQNPSLMQFGYLVRNYSEKGGGILKPFQKSEVGYKSNYDKYDSKYYFSQEFKPFSQYGIKTFFNQVWGGRVVESNVYEQLRKNSLKFVYDMEQSNKPQFFDNSFIDNPENLVYLQFSQKSRNNKVDTNHSSRKLMEHSLGNDQILSAKLGFKFNKAFDEDLLQNTLSAKASTEIASNSIDNKYIKTKFFARYMTNIKRAIIQASISGGFINPLQGKTQQKVNDNFYLKNFKGIRNVGYYYDQNNPVKGISGENLGFNKYLNFNLKVLQYDMPLLSHFNIHPFFHANIAFAPNRHIEGDQQHGLKNIIKNYARAAFGIGLQLQLPSIAIECYFNPIVYRQKNEIKSEFQINFGID